MKLDPFRALYMTITCAIIIAPIFILAEVKENQRSPVVQTKSGAVVGKIETLPHGKSVHEYLGIPYAEPPVGELRFAAPKPAKPWSATKNTTESGAWCPQSVIEGVRELFKTVKMSEDCLFLNVFVPSTIKPNDKMAVMVWFHGGGFAFGSANNFPGVVLAAFNDVIVVSVNYRLGILGFFNIPGTDVKGNYGILDQVLALKWVQANIENFGGDANKVTIFGESAGGISVSIHLISPLSSGLFHRAIMQSGASSGPYYCGKVTNTEQLELFAKRINCSLESNLVDCVRSKAVEEIVTAQATLTFDNQKTRLNQNVVGPVVDKHLLPDLPENLFKEGKFHADIDVLTGLTSNEGSLFALLRPPEQFKDGLEKNVFENIVKSEMLYHREKSQVIEDLILFQYTNHTDPDDKIATRKSMLEIYGDSLYDGPVMLEARALAKAGRLIYVYVFNHRLEYSPLPGWMGVIHGTDVPFVFGAPLMPDAFTMTLTKKYLETEKGLSLYVMKLWTDFAKYGSPNPPVSGPAPVTWPTFTDEEQAYLVLDLKPRVERRYKAKKMAFWNEIVPKVVKLTKKQKKEAEEKSPKDEL